MNWYKKAQNKTSWETYSHLNQWELKTKMKPLTEQYSAFLQKRWKIPLTPQEENKMKEVGNELDALGDVLRAKIELQQEQSEKLISQGKPHEVPIDNFMKYHYTGHISNQAYEKYRTKEGISWLNNYNKYPILIKSKRYGDEIIELRNSGEPLRYVKYDKNDDLKIMRDEKGKAVYLTEEEMKAQNLPLTDTTIVAFNQLQEPIGWVSDEFGADGVWVVEEYQGRGIGTDLLHEFRKRFPHKRKMGQMTEQGKKLVKKYHKKLVQDAFQQGQYVPEEILKEYGLIPS